MNLLVAGKSGWGKSWMCQRLTERNIRGEYEHVLLCDFKDEYRGLVSRDHGPGLAKHWTAGPIEVDQFGPEHYRALLEQNGNVVLAKKPGMTAETWREEVCERAIRGARSLEAPTLVVVDEAHFVAPQVGNVPDSIEGLATTGRGEGCSAMWVTQRLAKAEETVLSQCEARFLGGFGSDADLGKISGMLEYPEEMHHAGGDGIPASRAEALGFDVDGRLEGDRYPAVRKFKEGDRTVGSEWVYSDESGEVHLADSREMEMESEHVGAQGHAIDVGVGE